MRNFLFKDKKCNFTSFVCIKVGQQLTNAFYWKYDVGYIGNRSSKLE